MVKIGNIYFYNYQKIIRKQSRKILFNHFIKNQIIHKLTYLGFSNIRFKWSEKLYYYIICGDFKNDDFKYNKKDNYINYEFTFYEKDIDITTKSKGIFGYLSHCDINGLTMI